MDEPDEPPAAEGRVPTTAADFRELQREYSARRRFHEMQAETFARLEAEASRIAAGMESPTGALRISDDHATLATDMEAQTRQQRVSRARLDKSNRRHPFIAALVAKGLTVKVVAGELGYSRSTVQSWYDADKGNGRPIPRAAAEAIRAKYGVPLTAWHRISE